MDKLRIFLTSKIGWIMEVLITVTILFTSLFLPTAFVDIAVCTAGVFFVQVLSEKGKSWYTVLKRI